MASKNIVKSSTLAKFFRKDIRTVQLWAKNEGMPREGRDTFDFVECADWRIKKLEKENEELKGTGGVLYSSKERKEIAYARLAELEVLKEEKRIISIEYFCETLDKIITSIKTKVPNWPRRAAPEVFKLPTIKDIETKLGEHANRLLNDLSNIQNGAGSNNIYQPTNGSKVSKSKAGHKGSFK